MLKPQLLRELTLAPAAHPQHREWLSAASGLVCVKQWAYVVADDELQLGCFHFDQTLTPTTPAPLELITLVEGSLPLEVKQRKKAKADLESLALLPAFAAAPHGTLLTLGSGSKANRCRGQLLSLKAGGEVDKSGLLHLDLSALYESLHQHFKDLNIEGAFVAGSEIRLLQRGNKGRNESACLSYDYEEFLGWVLRERKHPPKLRSLLPLDFGSVDGVPLCPTDAAALGNGEWLVSLVAEDASDSYSDGRCVASAIALMDSSDKLSQLQRLQGNPKVEGLAVASSTGMTISLLMVTDADDPALAAQLLKVDFAH